MWLMLPSIPAATTFVVGGLLSTQQTLGQGAMLAKLVTSHCWHANCLCPELAGQASVHEKDQNNHFYP
jgi:hypothetical protein